MYVPSLFFLEKALAQLADHAIVGPFSGVLDGTYIGLGQVPTGTLTPAQDLSAITEATYSGYARLPLTWRGPYLSPNGSYSLQADGNYFVPTGSAITNQITTLFVADAITAGNLLFSETMPGGPIFMSGVTTAFSLSLLFMLATGNNYGNSILIQ